MKTGLHHNTLCDVTLPLTLTLLIVTNFGTTPPLAEAWHTFWTAYNMLEDRRAAKKLLLVIRVLWLAKQYHVYYKASWFSQAVPPTYDSRPRRPTRVYSQWRLHHGAARGCRGSHDFFVHLLQWPQFIKSCNDGGVLWALDPFDFELEVLNFT